MIGQERVLAIIPARGGSKGLPGKNIRALCGKPLIAWSIDHASQSSYIDRVILSTDDAETMRIGKAYGCEVPFVRPAEISSDYTPGIEPVLHTLQEIRDGELIVLLQPTSPLRSSADIDACIEAVAAGATSCVSVTVVNHPPEHMFAIDDNRAIVRLMGGYIPSRRQDLRKCVALNGAVYASKRHVLLERRTFLTTDVIGHIMPAERSVDIDTEFDFRLAEWLLSGGHAEVRDLG